MGFCMLKNASSFAPQGADRFPTVQRRSGRSAGEIASPTVSPALGGDGDGEDSDMGTPALN